MKTLLSKRVDAVVVMTSNASPEFFRRLATVKRVPVVAIDAPPDAVSSVFSDNSILGGRIVADFLADSGFSRIGCVSGPPNHPRMIDRLNGFTAALEERGLTLDPKLLHHGEISIDGGREAARDLLGRPAERGRGRSSRFAT